MRFVVLLLTAATLCAQPGDPAQQAQKARELVVAGKPDEAIPIYLELARAAPNDAAILVNLCIAEFKARRFRDTAGHAEAALKLQPDSLAANLFLGASYSQLGENARAIPPPSKRSRGALSSNWKSPVRTRRTGTLWRRRRTSSSGDMGAHSIPIAARSRRRQRCAVFTSAWRQSIDAQVTLIGLRSKNNASAKFRRLTAARQS